MSIRPSLKLFKRAGIMNSAFPEYLTSLVPGLVSLWIPGEDGRAIDIIGQNHGTVHGANRNVATRLGFRTEMVKNSGFENWTSPTDANDWVEYSEGNSSVNRETTEVYKGSYSLRFDVDSDDNIVNIQQTVSLSPNKRYRLQIWYKMSTTGKSAQVRIYDSGSNIWLDSNGSWVTSSTSITLSNTLDWKCFNLEFNAHPNYSNYIFIIKRGSAASSSIYFDSVSIQQLDPVEIRNDLGYSTDDIDDYISIPELIFASEYTFFGWVFREDNTVLDPIFAHNSETGKTALKSSGNNLHVVAYNGGSSDETVAIGQNKWNFFCVTRDSSNKVDAYVNSATPNRLFSDVAQSGVLRINRIGTDGTNYFNKYLAILGCGNKAFSSADVYNLYNATKDLFYPRG
ncbi:MAG: carbohydrate binding domain-containing protein [Candidatus Helarchaeota archaeon]